MTPPPELRRFPLPGSQTRHPEVAQWLADPRADPALQALAVAAFERLRAAGPDVTELMHDGHPTVCVGGLAWAYVARFRAHVNLGFFGGSTLLDPTGLLQGSGRFMRHVRLVPGEPVAEAALQALVDAAVRAMRAEAAT